MLGLAEFLTKSMLIISKTPIVTESVDVVPIRHRDTHILYTESETVDNGLNSWESLVAITSLF